MNSDFRVSTAFFDHPKTVRLNLELGDHGVLSLLRLFAYVATYHPRGNLEPTEIERGARWQGQPGALLESLDRGGWLDKVKGGSVGYRYRLHGWIEHNGYAYRSPERSKKARLAAASRWTKRDATSMPLAMLGDASSNAPAPAPAPVPDPELHPPIPPSGGATSPAAAGTANGNSPKSDRLRPRRQRGEFERLSEAVHDRVAARGEPSSTVIAKLAGQQAGLRGEPRDANHFPEGSSEREFWDKGWEAAQPGAEP